MCLSLSAAVSTRPIIIHLRNAIWALELLPNIEKEDQMHQWENTANDPPPVVPRLMGVFLTDSQRQLPQNIPISLKLPQSFWVRSYTKTSFCRGSGPEGVQISRGPTSVSSPADCDPAEWDWECLPESREIFPSFLPPLWPPWQTHWKKK